MGNFSFDILKSLFDSQKFNRFSLRNTDATYRTSKLNELKESIIRHTDTIIDSAINDYGRSREEEQNQIYAILHAIDHSINNLERWMRPTEVPSQEGSSSFIMYEPKGVVCIMGTWNSPLSTSIHPLIDSFGAGNCVILKPSELSPNYALVLKDIIEEVFSPEEVSVVLGDSEVANDLLNLPFDHFFFTGSPRVGKIVMEGASKHLAGVTLELGGKSPVIIEKGADMMQAVQNLVFSKVLMSGQICICPDYIFIHPDDVEAFKTYYSLVTQGMLYTDNGVIRDFDRTSIVNENHYNRLKNLYNDAISKGAEVLVGGDFNDGKRLIEPTVLINVTDDMLITQEEIFGPLTFLKLYEDVKDAVLYINQKPKPLALYIFSDNEDFQNFVLENTFAGGVTINGALLHNTHLELPFGGANNSGLGHFHGSHGFKALSHAKSVYKVLKKDS